MKRLFIFFLFLLAFFALAPLCHKATDGFAMVNVYAPKGDHSKWHREGEFPADLMKKPFTYFDSGSQSYIFLSEDQTVVLKLFKFQHMRTPPWLNFLPDFGKLKEKRAKKREILEKTFESLAIAYDNLKEETALLYLHLAKTNHLKKRVTLIDKIGKRHSVDLDQVEFLIQKKGTRAYKTIDKWIENGEIETAKKGIQTLLKLAAQRCQKGLFDKDPDFSTNFGFIGKTPFQIDFGRLSYSSEEKDPKIYAPEMIRITREFEGWIRKNHPLLLDAFTKELDEITTY
ncbi:MAG: hypothetical protein KDK76_01190 [Chlamydiia bacterium]|nr:hypothetical protein [Chlamydiia bacterium]